MLIAKKDCFRKVQTFYLIRVDYNINKTVNYKVWKTDDGLKVWNINA